MTTSKGDLSRRQFIGKVGAAAALPLLATGRGTGLRLERIKGRQLSVDLWIYHDPAPRDSHVNKRS